MNPLTGTAVLAPDGLDTHVTATEAAALCKVSTQAIANWVRRGHLAPAGLDEQGRRTYRIIDIAKAERATRARARR